jgi:hypothetical protein
VFHYFSSFKQPCLKASRLAGRELAVKLREPRYWDSPDALDLIDLNPPKPSQAPDGLREFFQRVVPTIWLDGEGKEQREVDIISKSNCGTISSKFYKNVLLERANLSLQKAQEQLRGITKCIPDIFHPASIV